MQLDEHFIMDFMKMNFLVNRETVSIIDSLFMVFLMMLLPSIIDMKKYIPKLLERFNWQNKHTVIIEGKRSLRSTHWNFKYNNLFSDDFRALWFYINKNYDFNKIYNIKSIGDYSSEDYEELNNDNQNPLNNMFYIVNQNSYFPLTKDIYCNVYINDNREESDKLLEMHGQVDTITIELYSYNKNVNDIKNFIEINTTNYLNEIERKRYDKKFIYTLENDCSGEENITKWIEHEYISYRSFDNMFFPHKDELLKKLIHFRDNKDEYNKNGDPYTLGICLYGPPGTGKTCIAKSIANMFGRHLVELPLDNIKTKSEFKKYFFESKYNNKNKNNTIGFDKKIILLEDIDCMSDIVFDREEKPNEVIVDNSGASVEMIEKLVCAVNTKDKKSTSNSAYTYKNNDEITLSFILNMLDGVHETPGRIMIMTSNYIHKIDKALKRPGRIDILLELGYVLMSTVEEFYTYHFNKKIPKNIQKTLNIEQLTPAEMVNIRRTTNDAKEFITYLQNRRLIN